MRYALALPFLALVAFPAAALARASLAMGSAPEIPWFRLIFSFLLCMGIAIGAILLLRRHQRHGSWGILNRMQLGDARPALDQIRILEVRRVSPTGRLCLIEFDERHFLLAVTDHAITILAERDATASNSPTGPLT